MQHRIFFDEVHGINYGGPYIKEGAYELFMLQNETPESASVQKKQGYELGDTKPAEPDI